MIVAYYAIKRKGCWFKRLIIEILILSALCLNISNDLGHDRYKCIENRSIYFDDIQNPSKYCNEVTSILIILVNFPTLTVFPTGARICTTPIFFATTSDICQ